MKEKKFIVILRSDTESDLKECVHLLKELIERLNDECDDEERSEITEVTDEAD